MEGTAPDAAGADVPPGTAGAAVGPCVTTPIACDDELLRQLVGILDAANAEAGQRLFTLDASLHRGSNPLEATHFGEMGRTAESGAEHLDAQLVACVEAMVEHKHLLPHGVTLFLHPPVFTCEQADELCQEASHHDGLALKNLFMMDKKKQLRYLVTACAATKTGFKEMAKAIEAAGGAKPKGGLTFAPDLTERLSLLPGSVTPLGLLNDAGGDVPFYLDQSIFQQDDKEFLSCHPNACHASVLVHRSDLVQFIQEALGHPVTIIPLDGSDSVELTAAQVLA